MSATFLSESTPVARKHYACQLCNSVIAAGDRHHVQANVIDGRAYNWRECTPCMAVMREVYAWAGSPEEGVDYDTALEWAHEHRTDDVLGDMARAYLRRFNGRGCGCEACEESR